MSIIVTMRARIAGECLCWRLGPSGLRASGAAAAAWRSVVLLDLLLQVLLPPYDTSTTAHGIHLHLLRTTAYAVLPVNLAATPGRCYRLAAAGPELGAETGPSAVRLEIVSGWI